MVRPTSILTLHFTLHYYNLTFLPSSGKYSAATLPKGPRGQLFRGILPTLAPVTAALEAIAEERDASPSQIAIAWCMAKGTIPIPGIKTVEQARDNLGAMRIRLSEGEVAELEAAAGRAEKKMLQNIFATD